MHAIVVDTALGTDASGQQTFTVVWTDASADVNPTLASDGLPVGRRRASTFHACLEDYVDRWGPVVDTAEEAMRLAAETGRVAA